MKTNTFFDERFLLWEALALSLIIHMAFMHVGSLRFGLHEKHTVEIDITNMGHIGMPAAPKRAAAPARPKPAVPQKQWIQPRPEQKAAPAPIPTKPVTPPPPEEPPALPSSGTGPVNGEYAIGTGQGDVTTLSRIPQLLNLSDLGAILQRFYPEEARAAGRQSMVVLDIHIDTDGHVTSADVVKSGGVDFDAAAQRAAKLLRFTPAFVGSQRVGVKMRQAIQFKLEQ